MKPEIYINTEIRGRTSHKVPAVVNISRDEEIISDEEGWKVCVERFYIHGAKLPLFDTQRPPWVIALRDYDTDAVTTRTIEWGGQRYLYDYRHVASYLTENITALATSLAIAEIDIPRFSFADKVFTIHTTNTFRESYEFLFNAEMAWALSCFLFAEDSLGEFERLVLEDDAETQEASTIELLSPVSRLALRTNTLPVQLEMLPPLDIDPDFPEESSNRTGGFLVDYKLSQLTNQSTQGIEYIAPIRRWHSVKDYASVASFNISAHWVDYTGTYHDIMLPVRSSEFEIKVLFQKWGDLPHH